MHVDRMRIAAGWLGLAAALSAGLLFAAGTWTGPLEPFVDRPWALLASQALSVLLWVGVPGVAGWLLLREERSRNRVGGGLLAAYGLPAGPEVVGTFAGGGVTVSWQGVGFAVFGVLLLVGALIAIGALLSDDALDILRPGGWERAPLRALIVAAVAVSAVLYVLPALGLTGTVPTFEAFQATPLAVRVGGLVAGAALVAVAYLAVAVSLPVVGAAMLAGLGAPLFLRWATGVLGHWTEWLGAREPALMVLEGVVLAVLIGGALILVRGSSTEREVSP